MPTHHILRSSLVYLALSVCITPISASPLHPRLVINCTDLSAVYDSQCWAQLGISDFLDDPKTGWNVTTKTCSESDDGSNCCAVGEPWSTCFLRVAYLQPGYDCTQLDSQTCTASSEMLAGTIPSTLAPKYRYVSRAVFGNRSSRL